MARIISIIPWLLACLLGAAPAVAQDEPAKDAVPLAVPADTPAPAVEGGSDIKLQDSPPARYTVKRGDTLWGISNRFLKTPWPRKS